MTTEKSPKSTILHDAFRTPEGRRALLAGSAMGIVAVTGVLHATTEEPHTRPLRHVTSPETLSTKEVQEQYWSEVNRHKQIEVEEWLAELDAAEPPQGETMLDTPAGRIVHMPKSVVEASVGKVRQEPAKATAAEKAVGEVDRVSMR